MSELVLDTAIDAVESAVETCDLQAQDRVKKGNALWAEMSRLGSIGRSLFEYTDEALYNDYVLIGSSPAVVNKPNTIGGAISNKGQRRTGIEAKVKSRLR